eukprot:5530066-Prymnesium_polylepis.4
MKYGIAATEPQSPWLVEHSPPDSSFIASAIRSDHPSLVRHCSRTRMALPMVSKLRWSLMPPCTSLSGSPCDTNVNRLTPSTAKIKMISPSNELTLISDGKERIISQDAQDTQDPQHAQQHGWDGQVLREELGRKLIEQRGAHKEEIEPAPPNSKVAGTAKGDDLGGGLGVVDESE